MTVEKLVEAVRKAKAVQEGTAAASAELKGRGTTTPRSATTPPASVPSSGPDRP